MNTTTKTFACLCMMAGLLTGCSMKDDTSKDEMSKANKSSEKMVEDTKEAADKTKNTTKDSIDNMMTYFKNEGMEYENMQNIEEMEFAAHEGRSFMMNGKTTYLYRVKSDDADMKKVMDEAKETGKAKVKINNEEMEYGALVNGDYLLLYDTSEDFSNMEKTFPNYKTAGMNGNDDTIKHNSSTNNKNESVTEE